MRHKHGLKRTGALNRTSQRVTAPDTINRRARHIAAALAAAAALLSASPWSESPAHAADKTGGGDRTVSDRSRPVTAGLKDAGGTVQAGARVRLGKMEVRELTLQNVADAVLNHNFDVRSAAQGVKSADALVRQFEAAFDPTVFATLNYKIFDTGTRVDYIDRLRNQDPFRPVTVGIDDEGNPITENKTESFCQATIEGVVLDASSSASSGSSCFEPPVMQTAAEAASSSIRALTTISGSIGISKRFLVGTQVSLAVSSSWRKRYGGTPPFLTNVYTAFDPYGWGDSPGLFWSSTASLSVSTPLPYTKGFGEDGSTDGYNLHLAQSGSKQAGLSEKAQRNNVLTAAFTAYFDLVQGVENLRSVVAHRQLLSGRMERQKRLLEAGTATQYDVTQAEVELANLAAQEEIVWNTLLQGSNVLATLMAVDQKVLLLPKDPAKVLAAPVRIAGEGAQVKALEASPEIKLQDALHDLSKVTLTYRENQTLPDISLRASASVGESDSVYGYNNLGNALAHLTRPDTANLFVGVYYRIPLGNQALESQLARARVEERQAFDRARQTRQDVVNRVDLALATALSAKAQVGQASEDAKLTQIAYDQAIGLRDQGLVSEFETINRYNDLLNARLNVIDAQVRLRKAHIGLLSAQGVLEQEYVR